MINVSTTSFDQDNEEIAIAIANKILEPFGFICQQRDDGMYGINAYHVELNQSYFIPFNNDGTLDEQQLYRLPVKIANRNREWAKKSLQSEIRELLGL